MPLFSFRSGSKRKYLATGHFNHPSVGEVALKVLSSAKHVTARWKSSSLLAVTVPPYTTAEAFEEIFERMLPRILARRPVQRFFVAGWQYVTPENTFRIQTGTRTNIFSGHVDKTNRITTLFFPPDLNPEGNESFNRWVNETLKKYSVRYAPLFLLPLANALAEKFNVRPRSIGISYGSKVLGRCDSRGNILLSRNLVFYPSHLRELVILHEFAHLTHMNHSAAFKSLLNTFTGGRLAELNAQLKAHRLPYIL